MESPPRAGEDVVQNGDGRAAGTAVLALTDDGDVVLTRRVRPGPERVLWDLPGGFIDDDEDPLDAARRELREETGFEAGTIDRVGATHPSAHSTETRIVFTARGCRPIGNPDTDAREDVTVHVVPVAELRRILRAGDLTAVDAGYLALDHAGLLIENPADGFHGLVGLAVGEADHDASRVTLDANDAHLNRHGTVHGGAIASLADAAMGAAVAADGSNPVTVEMKVTYIEPARPGRLVAEGNVRRRGKHISIVEADIFGADGEAVAHGTATFTTI